MKIEQWLDTDLGRDIWAKKYQQGTETFEEWVERVSGGDEDVAQLIKEQKFLFGGRILANRGLAGSTKLTYSNCYVLKPPGDSIEEIYETASKLARTFSYGGGVGIDISELRPEGYPVNNAAKTTSGAVSFMDTFEQVSRTIGQAGRRGALMLSMSCEHPDVEKFIDAKLDNKLEKCNISVRMSDDFMREAQEQWTKENKILNHLAENNWNWAEPGILYWDTIEQYNILNKFDNFKYAGVNPCAEEPLPAGGSCLLGALNLAAFVDKPFTKDAAFNVYEFRKAVKIAVKALNDVLDEGLELHPLQEQRESVREWRQIGLGIMGYGDLLLKLGKDYGTIESRQIIKDIGGILVDTGLETSAQLAQLYGAFPACDDNNKLVTSNFIKDLADEGYISSRTISLISKYGLRNSQLFTIAPTGSISTMIGVTGGVEPMFATHYTRKTQALHGEDVFYKVYTPIVQDMLDNKVITEDEVDSIVTAQNIKPVTRVLTQAVWQKFIDASISSTVNLTNDATIAEIRDLYVIAWETGCKGLTIYRAGCSKEGVLVVDGQQAQNVKPSQLERGQWAAIPEDTIYLKRKVYTGCGKLNLFIGWSAKENRVVDMYAKRSGQGGCEHNIDSTVICMSGMLRLGGTLDTVEKAFSGCGACNSFTKAKASGKKLSKGKSCPTAILHTIKDTIENLKELPVLEQEEKPVKEEPTVSCPECGAKLQMTGGCNVCSDCGYTKCD